MSIIPLTVAAGQGGQQGSIGGVVRRSLDSVPVAVATVTLDGSTAAVMTDSAGAFVIRAVPAGSHEVHVRHLGYEPRSVRVTVSGGAASSVDIGLQAVAQQLTTVRVAGESIEIPMRLAGVAERVDRNHGILFTSRDIAPEDRTRNVLQRLPGVNVNDRSVTFARCQDTGSLPGPFGGTASAGVPKVEVYVDGLRVTHGSNADVGAIIDGINPASIALMEVYTGMARIPAEFLADACAVIAIWTKSY